MRHSFLSDFTRRDLIRCGLASALGLSSSGWLPRLARAAEAQPAHKACILLWMAGGPTQTDTFDMKPKHANGGPFKPIVTAAPGVNFCEHLPKLAKEAGDLAIVRGLTSAEGDHQRGTQLMLTGYRPGGPVNYPALGSLLAKELGQPNSELPNYVSLSPLRAADLGAGFLGPEYSPLTVSGASDDPNARANLSIENLTPQSGLSTTALETRFDLLKFLQKEFQEKHPGMAVTAHQANYERAERMVRTQARAAFKLDQEPAALRDAYGRNRFGQGCLLARRLVERGVPFVEVTLSQVPGNGGGWDTHIDNFNLVKNLLAVLDPAWSTLLRDLRERSLLDSTLVVWMGEFGRTPQINANSGRDHFPAAWSTVLGGAGIRGGQAYGDTGVDGMKVEQDGTTVPELLATICAALGIDPATENISPEGRPIAIVDGKARPKKVLLKSS